jgi:UPF0042 nucleotide-binding protein
MRVILVTGMSGSGKSIALNVLEDAGYAAVDNLPARFLLELIGEMQEHGQERVAVSIDIRAGVESVTAIPSLLPVLRRYHDVQLLFLTANTPTLVQRYSETRRRHPLSTTNFSAIPASASGHERTLEECIDDERKLLGVLDGVGHLIDTSDLPSQTLRYWVRDFLGKDRAGLVLLFESFGYKHGVPLDADLVFDVRCLPNPFYYAELSPLTGRDQPVIDFFSKIDSVQQMIDDIFAFVARWLPVYVLDGRSYLTVAIGCTGGQHRSVYCVERLAERFRSNGAVLVRHRALSLPAQAVTKKSE